MEVCKGFYEEQRFEPRPRGIMGIKKRRGRRTSWSGGGTWSRVWGGRELLGAEELEVGRVGDGEGSCRHRGKFGSEAGVSLW